MSNHTHDPDHLLPVDSVPENNLVILDEGIEIQHTKSYGIGIDCLFSMSNKQSYTARNIIPQVSLKTLLAGTFPPKSCGIIIATF